MWPFKDKARTQSRGTDWGSMAPVRRTRGDATLTTSEAIYAAVSRISNTVAMLPLHLYRGMELQKDDWREKLMQQPNPGMTPFFFQQTMEAFRNTEGNAYALLVPTEGGRNVERLDVLDASRVTPLRDRDTKELYYRFYLDDGTEATVHNSRVLALHHMSANGEKGVRPLDVLRGTLEYNQAIREFSVSQLDGINSGVMLTVPGTSLNTEKKQAVINQFLEAYKASAGKVVVLEGGITASMFSQSPIDTKTLDVERITRNRVATVYNIPPHMLGDYSDTSYSTAEQSNAEYLSLTIMPIVAQWEQELDSKLLTWNERKRGMHFRFDISALTRADTATMGNLHQQAIRGGWMTPNEVRAADGLPPMEDGNELMASRDLVPLRILRQEQSMEDAQQNYREGI